MSNYNTKDLINRLDANGIRSFEVNFPAKTFFIRCPVCKDSKKNLDKGHVKVMVNKDEFRCYRCGDFYGNIRSLFDRLSIKLSTKKLVDDRLLKDIANDKYIDKNKDISDIFVKKNIQDHRSRIGSSTMDLSRLRKTIEFEKSFLHDKAINYMCGKRGFNKEFIKSNKDKFIIGSNGRLLTKVDKGNSIRKTFGRINFISNNRIFIQGRSFLDIVKRKYYIYYKQVDEKEDNEMVPDVIFFRTQNDSILVIVEGPFDAFRLYSLGISSISIQGVAASNLSNAMKIFKPLRDDIEHFKEYCILLDNDISRKKCYEFCTELIAKKSFSELFISELPKNIKDPGEIRSFHDLKTILSKKKPYSNMLKVGNMFNSMLGN